MVDEAVTISENDTEEVAASRIYEVGYTIAPSVKEEDVERIVASIRSEIEKASGSFIAEGAPSVIRLAYPMTGMEAGKRVEYDRGYFGWLKFEAAVSVAALLEGTLKRDANVIRFIVFRTVREDTRAKMKAPQLREVKRTDTIKMTVRRTEEPSVQVSEEELEKALQDITTD